ncbi:hypothetical protein PGT21_015940 [Puccinia graminis f. sp. tritici]|uniref:Uncharacterized protein n=1 Tax=Puccinia graminis f. sp. tritici TaxID=56615 RepID=A0A5B0LIZ8_PUCGR|nr:hypothetical protein PGT21_015940 [Puccinia graminis f. sp. tritici]
MATLKVYHTAWAATASLSLASFAPHQPPHSDSTLYDHLKQPAPTSYTDRL